MFLLKVLFVMLLVFLIGHLVEKLLRRIFNIEKRKGFLYKPVNRSQKIGEGVLLVLFLIGFVFHPLFLSQSFEPFILIIIYIIMLDAYRAFMEWKYQKESKEYIITVGSLVLFLLFIYFIFKLNILEVLFN